MAAPIKGWFTGVFSPGTGGISALDLFHNFDMVTRNPSPLALTLDEYGLDFLYSMLDADSILGIADYVLGSEERPLYSARLEEILARSGSIWKVGTRDGLAGLERRVPEGVQIAAEAVMASPTTAGALLSEAWHGAFGREPDFEEAYEKAIKAVEEAGYFIVTPANNKATLGTMARDMESQGDWKLELGENAKHPSGDVVCRMVRSLWEGQESRHGGNGYRKPTQGEAEAAVMLAVPLVQWFSSGAVARR
jgi:hypothetical protein